LGCCTAVLIFGGSYCDWQHGACKFPGYSRDRHRRGSRFQSLCPELASASRDDNSERHHRGAGGDRRCIHRLPHQHHPRSATVAAHALHPGGCRCFRGSMGVERTVNLWTGEYNIAVFSIHAATGEPTPRPTGSSAHAEIDPCIFTFPVFRFGLPPPARRSTLD
jgi:hypothetical protein